MAQVRSMGPRRTDQQSPLRRPGNQGAELIGSPQSTRAESLRRLGAAAVCVLLAASLLACTNGGGDATREQRLVEPEANDSALEESVESSADATDETGVLDEGQDDLDTLPREAEEAESKSKQAFSDKEEWTESKSDGLSPPEGDVLERTARLAEDSGGEVHLVDHAERGDRSVLVTPQEFVDGETPLIVSLHGYGGNSADHSHYAPLHQRVISRGFGLLLPNGSLDAQGNSFWNPTDQCCDGGKTGEDDVAYLTELVSEANKIKDFGPVYFFGHSNGGFMAHHMACKGLPGLRAAASLAGTSYVEDSSCAGAPPVSALHIHGTADSVILFAGDESEARTDSGGRRAFYLGAWDLVTRWSRLAGCDWPEDPEPRAILDLDQYTPGSETKVYRPESGCAEGVNIELWVGEGSGHAPGYSDAFVDALLDWLLSQ